MYLQGGISSLFLPYPWPVCLFSLFWMTEPPVNYWLTWVLITMQIWVRVKSKAAGSCHTSLQETAIAAKAVPHLSNKWPEKCFSLSNIWANFNFKCNIHIIFILRITGTSEIKNTMNCAFMGIPSIHLQVHAGWYDSRRMIQSAYAQLVHQAEISTEFCIISYWILSTIEAFVNVTAHYLTI